MQLTLALASALILAPPASAQDWTLGADVMVYDDSDAVTAVTPQVSVHRALGEDGGEIWARGAIDAYTAASVDVVAQATPSFDEVRVEGSFGVLHPIGDLTSSFSYRGSTEPDWASHGLAAGFERRLGTPDSVLSGGYGLTWDRIGRVDTPFQNWSRDLFTHSGDLGFTQVLGPRLLVRVVYSLLAQHGYMEKTYRFVPLFAAPVDEVLTLDEVHSRRLDRRPGENVPDVRLRNALALRAMRFVEPLSGSVRLDYRFYVDTWGVTGHTAELAVRSRVANPLSLELRSRGHYQTSASFWERAYVSTGGELPRFRTVDKQLGRQWTLTGGARVEVDLPARLAVYLTGDAIFTDFLDHLYIDDRFALLFQTGIRWEP